MAALRHPVVRRRAVARPSPFALGLGAIVLAALGIRLAQTFLVAPWPPGIFADDAYYTTLAKLIAHGTGFVRPGEWFGRHLAVPTAERPPLYPLLLAGVGKLFGGGSDVHRAVGSFTGAGTVAAVGVLARRLAGPRVGLLAAGMAAVYPTLVAADGAVMTESLFGLLVVGSLIAAYRAVDAPTPARAALLGGLLGLAALTRGDGTLLLPLLLVPLLRARAWRAALVVVVAFVVVLAPWTIRNWTRFHRPVLVATETGETLAGANCRQVYSGPDIGDWTVACLHFSGTGNEAAKLDAEGRRGVRYAEHHAGRLPAVIAARLGRTWGFYQPFKVTEGRSPTVMRAGVYVYWALLPLAAYGLVLLRRRRRPIWILVSPLVAVTVTTILSYGNLRFRHSAELVVVILAAVAVDRLGRGIRVSPARRPPAGTGGRVPA